jgi:uncharacterized membrane protein YkoI
MKNSTLTAAALASAFTLAIATAAAYPGQQFAKQATITLTQARAIALRAVPNGKIVAEELEKEPGGSGLRYSFDMKSGGKTREIGIDAKTGKILENALEGKNPD